ncbi:MAG: hypothetical protein PUP90_30260 [Nostoc sp. S4]|nr:hypothetical protein [Nostoc sp. S4]
MQPLETLTLKAFVSALSYLDAPLPNDVQKQVNQVKIPDDIGELDAIARNYAPLAPHYQTVRQNFAQKAQIRSKGPLPAKIDRAAEQQSTEINNILVIIDEQIDEEQLTKIATQTLQSPDPVSQLKILIRSLRKSRP